ncbi:taste receptor type 2 member 40-like [Rhinatrema bivittatum]|uniref:taste receptor type 2 member 40-like n=1 Tax=Rhinatrema bivittatum TaxID=194408 RepID=UPI00112EF0EA|nr:taste receptor type 2 member 40-like [Rhinatrema bivittatum]
MSFTVQIALLIAIAPFTVLGSVVNAFIVVVNGIDWVKTRHLNSIDVIVTCLGTARFLLLWIVILENIFFFNPYLFTVVEFLNAFYAIWAFLDLADIWFAALLCIFYCAKTASLNHPLFIFLKSKIPGSLPWLLLGSMLACLLTSFPLAWRFYDEYQRNSTTSLSSNNSMITNLSLAWDLSKEHKDNFTKLLSPYIAAKRVSAQENKHTYLMLELCLGYSLPFFICCVAIVLMIGSLLDHTWRMKDNAMGYCNPSLQVYFTVIKVMLSFLLLCVTNFILLMLILSEVFPTESPWNDAMLVVIAAYQSLHSVILILNNSKLRQVLERIFRHATCSSGGANA